ncbi:spermidine synthase [Paramicrobacterium sp. CJ85]|uniref:spermidine synthase n=1 Tax=Paramicrobacterium sp. CJ85 TaxID=3445355 RepID=UPI003F5D8791
MSERATIVLKRSGLAATIEPDQFVPGAYQLVVDGTPQSHVNMDDPRELFYEYVRRIGHVVDLVRAPGDPITAVHLGAGALTLPRYVDATRPGSRQQVIELERDLVDFVRATIPWSKRAQIRVRYGDAREVVERLPEGIRGTADLVVSDIFNGAQTPAHVTTTEFYARIAALLAADGILAVNVADGPGLAFARAQAATLQAVFPEVAAFADTQILKGRRFGNVVLIASRSLLPLDLVPRLLAAGPYPAKLVAGPELRNFVAGARPVSDGAASPSPEPSRNVFDL